MGIPEAGFGILPSALLTGIHHLHIKTSKIMEPEEYATLIGLFGREWRIR
jgi:hypothetical protein